MIVLGVALWAITHGHPIVFVLLALELLLD